MYVCMYACIYVCMYGSMKVYTYMYVCVCMYVCTYVYMCVCMYVCIYVCMYVFMYVCITYVCVYVCASCVHFNIHILHVAIQLLIFMSSIPMQYSYILRNNFSGLIEFVDGIKITSVTGKVNNNINRVFRVEIYEAESGVTYPLLLLLLLLLLYFNNCYIIIMFLDVISYYGFPVLSL